MKKNIVLTALALALVSCNNSEEKSVEEVIAGENLTEVKAKKQELSKQQSEINTKLDRLEEAIIRLDPEQNFQLVTTTTLRDTTFRHFIEVQGDVSTRENIIIQPEYSGVLTAVFVKEGEQVRKGALIARIDDGGLSNQLAQAEVQAELAKTTFERQKRLWEQNIGSEIQYLQAKTNYESAQNTVKQLRSQLNKTAIRAPFSGVIDQVFTEQGEMVNAGQSQLFRLVNLENMFVKAAVPESYLEEITLNTPVTVIISAIGRAYEGSIRQVGNFINPSNRTFQIEVSIPNKDRLIKPNLIATVKLNDYTAENTLVIPESIIQKNAAGESYIYVAEDFENKTAIAKKQVIETGRSYDKAAEVTAGLKPGDRVITEGGKNLMDEQKIKIKG